ncbi:hypothetical protein FDP22_15400 [Paroceanicella profunda]|uniref:Uncharacterized protein n=1 Tax=Paroceanicella profunda TaxID=2579971 RepID=A0A5B8FIG5_9RHOB|nr:hypothetical protein [Paroceanicella profunda]QDL93048.1 hypothetical protein FDP22_15400 [Paroceanicella profunda]
MFRACAFLTALSLPGPLMAGPSGTPPDTPDRMLDRLETRSRDEDATLGTELDRLDAQHTPAADPTALPDTDPAHLRDAAPTPLREAAPAPLRAPAPENARAAAPPPGAAKTD